MHGVLILHITRRGKRCRYVHLSEHIVSKKEGVLQGSALTHNIQQPVEQEKIWPYHTYSPLTTTPLPYAYSLRIQGPIKSCTNTLPPHLSLGITIRVSTFLLRASMPSDACIAAELENEPQPHLELQCQMETVALGMLLMQARYQETRRPSM